MPDETYGVLEPSSSYRSVVFSVVFWLTILVFVAWVVVSAPILLTVSVSPPIPAFPQATISSWRWSQAQPDDRLRKNLRAISTA
jgi:hypothetical protein